MSTPLVIYGAGGFAREVAWQAMSYHNRDYQVVCFVDDNGTTHGTQVNGIPVLSLSDAHRQFPAARVALGIGSPWAREMVAARASEDGYMLATLIHPDVMLDYRTTRIGPGTIVCAGTVLTVNIDIQACVQINLACTIGHDVVLGEFTTLAPGVNVSGWVHCGKRVYMGTGARIINGSEDEPLVIADDVVIGAGAVVIRSIPEPGVTVVGVPARIVKAIPAD